MSKILKKFEALNPLVKALLAFIILSLSLAFLFAPEPQPVDYQDIDFETTSDSRIYFNNVRSFYYHIDRRSKRPMEIYRLKRRIPERDSLGINFAIAHYPGGEQAFIVLEKGSTLEYCDSLQVHFEAYPLIQSLSLLNGEEQYQFAAKVYTSLLEKKEVLLYCGQDSLKALYANRADRLDAEIVLEDYFRLVGKN